MKSCASTDMAHEKIRVLLDTNILISAIVYGGKPEEILRFVIERKITAITSPVLLGELQDILVKKFGFSAAKSELLRQKMRKNFITVHPTRKLSVLKDDPDNRVLEAAAAGRCRYIITGDRELLKLNSYQSIKIVTPQQFLESP